MVRATIIHNPNAGRLNVGHMLPAVCSALGEHGWRVKACSTAGIGRDNDLTALARNECEEGADAVRYSWRVEMAVWEWEQ